MVADADGSHVRQLSDRHVGLATPCWSPNDQFIRAAADGTVVLFPLDGSAPVDIPARRCPERRVLHATASALAHVPTDDPAPTHGPSLPTHSPSLVRAAQRPYPRPLEVHRHERTRQDVGRRHSSRGGRADLHRLRIIGQRRRRRPDADPRRDGRPHAHSRPATPTAAPSPTPQVLPSGDSVALEPGRRYAFPSRGTNPRISFTVPSGWAGNSTLVEKDHGDSGPAAPFLFAWPFDHGFKDPCTDHTPVLPAAGSGAAGLLAVIAGQPGIDAGPITDVTVGGHDGKYVDYTVTADPATCGNGAGRLLDLGHLPGAGDHRMRGRRTGDRRYGVSKNDRERAYAIDVDGKTYTFFTNQPADLLAADRAEFQQVLDSIEFEPAG